MVEEKKKSRGSGRRPKVGDWRLEIRAKDPRAVRGSSNVKHLK